MFILAKYGEKISKMHTTFKVMKTKFNLEKKTNIYDIILKHADLLPNLLNLE